MTAMPVNPELLPPHDDEAEAGALACILTADASEAPAMLDKLARDDFYDLRHRELFAALRCLRIDAKPLDLVALVQLLRDTGKTDAAGGLDYLTALPDKAPSPAAFPTYLDAVKDRATRRAALRDAGELSRLATDTSIPAAGIANAARRLAHSYATASTAGQPDPWLTLIEDAAQSVTKDLPPIVEIVAGIVSEQSKLGIGSSSKSNKTWLAMDCGLSIAHGVPFLGHETTRRRVLYLNLELKAQTFERRLQAIARAKGISVEPTWFRHLALRGRLAGTNLNSVISRLAKIAPHLGIAVIVVDPTYKLNTEGAENDSRDQTLFYNQVDRLTTEAGCTVILIDHSGKGNQSEKDPLDVFRGSSVKGGDLDAAMILRRHEVEGCFRVDLVHRELPPVAPFTVGWNYPLMELRPDLDPDAMKKAGAGRKPEHDPRKLLAVIADRTAGNPISVSAWAAVAKVTRQTLQGYLPTLRGKGWISTAGQGNTARQFITPAGQKTAQEYRGELQ